MTAKATSGRCVFCGTEGVKLTKEHIWSDWIRRTLSEEQRSVRLRHDVRDSKRGPIRNYSSRLFTLTAKDVCEPCNGGWMHDLEGAVRPYLVGMLHGDFRHLDERGQEIVAAWFTLKSLMAHRTFPRPDLIPERHYHALYAIRGAHQPPAGTIVAIGKTAWTNGRAQAGYFRTNGLYWHGLEGVAPPGQEANGYIATFSVLDVVGQVVRLYDDRMAVGVQREDFLRPIFPSRGPFIWPCTPTLTDAGLSLISGETAVGTR